MIVLLVAVAASILTRATGGSAATSSNTRYVTQVNVTVHLKSGSKSYSDVDRIRLYAGGKKFRVVTRSGATHTFGSSFRSYTETYLQKTVTTPVPTPSSTPTITPSSTPTTSPTASPTSTSILPSGLPTLLPTSTATSTATP
jgi:hypothetical protein